MKKRLYWLDISKAISILLMVVGHTSIPSFASNFIWSFHMPLFFVSSGCTTDWSRNGMVDFVKRKSRSLLLPFAIYSMIVLGIQVALGWNSVRDFLWHGWVAYALWFIPVLFISLVCSKCIYSIKKSLIRYLILSILLMMGCIFSKYHIQLPWTLSSVPYATCMIAIGVELRKVPSKFVKPKWYMIIGFLLITILVSNFWRLDMCFNSILPIVPITIGAFSGTLMVYMISMKIEKHSKYLTKAFVAIGKETYIIVAFSQISIMLLNEYFHLNAAIKYGLLVVVLVVLKSTKDGINKLFNSKIL